MGYSVTGTHKGNVTKDTVLVRVLQRTNPKTGSQQAGYPEVPMMQLSQKASKLETQEDPLQRQGKEKKNQCPSLKGSQAEGNPSYFREGSAFSSIEAFS